MYAGILWLWGMWEAWSDTTCAQGSPFSIKTYPLNHEQIPKTSFYRIGTWALEQLKKELVQNFVITLWQTQDSDPICLKQEEANCSPWDHSLVPSLIGWYF